ncbi:MAG: hypothetical protein R3213_01580 [Flavobacteriaceae bacterium]|nr:hypothetical protein [Flavobacteriaceae bacterium]
MKKYIVYSLMIGMLVWSCEKDNNADPYLIGKQQIGMLTDSTQVGELKKIFPNDSVSFSQTNNSFGNDSEIEIYSNEGKNILTLTPLRMGDSTSSISSVQIKDPSFKTAKNVSIQSTFKDINDNYKIAKINNLINSIVLSVPELNASFTIDKKELPPNLRYDLNMKIEKSQIPDNARIKYFMLHWD